METPSPGPEPLASSGGAGRRESRPASPFSSLHGAGMGKVYGTDKDAPPILAHHVLCRCPDCDLERELDAAFIRSGMVTAAVAVESGRVELETDE